MNESPFDNDYDFIASIDLGKRSDYSALALIMRAFVKDLNEKNKFYRTYTVCGLKRWEIGTNYTNPPGSTAPSIVPDLVRIVGSAPLELRRRDPAYRKIPIPVDAPLLAIDQTGVGEAVVDMIKAAKPRAILHPILITSGHKITNEYGTWHLPKKELASILHVLLGTDRLKVSGELPMAAVLVKEMQEFSVKITPAGNESFECLTAGTMATTRHGEKPIETVEQDDDVLTRTGYHRVLWSGQTKVIREVCRVECADGRALQGTADHLVWTENRGWVEMGNLSCQDLLCILQPRASCLTGSSTGSRRAIRTTSTRSPRMLCTEQYGSITTARFLKGMTSIMPMRTPRTTVSTTLSASLTPTMLGSTSREICHSSSGVRPRDVRSISSAAGQEMQATMTRENDFAPSVARMLQGQSENSSASSAASHFRQMAMDDTRRSDSVRAPAERRTGTSTGCTHSRNASSAETTFDARARSTYFAHVAAPPSIVSLPRPVPVYDLIVEDDHEFFANGILVHNSWREKDHDDLVLAVAMGCWIGERGVPFRSPSQIPNPQRPKSIEERRRMNGSGWNRKGMYGTHE